MDSEKLSHAIRLHDEIVLLKDILSAANNQPDLILSFPSSKDKQTFIIENEALVYEILKLIRDQKERLEEVFKEI